MTEIHRKCPYCDKFNKPDALFCVRCGRKIIKVEKKNFRKRHSPSYKKIALLISLVLFLGVSILIGMNYFRRGKSSELPPSSSPLPISVTNVSEKDVIAVAKNFACACGGCNELPLADCHCDMPRGALEEKKFIREMIARNYTVEKIINLLDKKYGHRI